MSKTEVSPGSVHFAVYDETEALEGTGGDAELAAELMDALLAGLPDEMAALDACLGECDWPGLAEYAHQVRSATGYCGVPALNASISALERAARAEDPARCNETLAEARYQVQQLYSRFGRSAPVGQSSEPAD